MCEVCKGLSRRGLLSAGAAAAIAATGPAFASDPPASGVTPDEALKRLKAGNARFMADPEACVANLGAQRSKVAKKQSPWATVVGCADSRTPPELLFGGTGLGELFVARNAGNLVDIATLGTVEYGAEHLGSPLIVVLGHERCGAVTAACDVATRGVKLPSAMGPMVAPMVPVVRAVQKKSGDLVNNVVIASAQNTAAHLTARSPILRHLVEQKKLMIVAAYYDLDDGRVDFLQPAVITPPERHSKSERPVAARPPASRPKSGADEKSWWDTFLQN